jgi:hypothetical protein
MRLETGIALEDSVRKEVIARFPSLDPTWAVNRRMDKIYENSRKTAQVLMAMVPEIIRSQRLAKETV